jgi:hypothetical protein
MDGLNGSSSRRREMDCCPAGPTDSYNHIYGRHILTNSNGFRSDTIIIRRAASKGHRDMEMEFSNGSWFLSSPHLIRFLFVFASEAFLK